MSGQELLGAFVGGMVVALAGAVVLGISAFLKRRVRMTGPQAEAVAENAKSLAQVRPLVAMLVDIQKPQLMALLAILGALKDKMNGTFERPDKSVRAALDTFDGTLKDIATGKHEELKP
ncbi:MAG: hypothetical protein IMZ69_08365 [Spirochaetes bacterium]|nr:hypothetical protein [Spirochaetota bacterium]